MKIHCKYDELVEPKKLKVHPKNRNKHSKEQIERLAKLYSYHGIRHPIIVSSRSGYIVAGHGRKAAAHDLGMKEFPVVYQDFDTDEAEYAFIQADNAIALWAELDLSGINSDLGDLGPDFDVDMLGIKNFEIDVADKDFEADEDEVPEARPEPKVVQGEVYILGNHRLMCGDSTSITDVDRLMNGEKAELCFTSPPYSDQREYNGGKELSTEHLATFIRSAYGSVRYFAVNLGYSRKNGEVNPYWDDYIKEAKNCGLKLLSWNIWDRLYPASIAQQTAMFPVEHEWIFVFGEKEKELNKTLSNKGSGSSVSSSTNRQADGKLKRGKKREVGSHRPMGTILECDIHRGDSPHPAMFPVQFPESYIEAMTDVGQFVYEPFTGSGSTLIASEKTDRKCYGMELDPIYCGVILDRWQKFTGKKAHREDGKPWDEIKGE